MSSDELAGGQGAQQPSDAEYGHSEGPDERNLPLIQMYVVSLHAREVHQLLDVLRKPSKPLFDTIPPKKFRKKVPLDLGVLLQLRVRSSLIH